MAEVQFPEVKDRNVATPSRVRLTKAVGIEDDNVFDVEGVPGTVYEEGTPLNKEFFDKLKLYMDNNVGSPDNPVPITNGGTGANSVEGARTNLDVYSTTEVDEIVERAGAKIDPHINSKVTDTPEGVHGLYIDGNNILKTDPDGDGNFIAVPFPNENIANGAVTTDKISNSAVTNEKINDKSVSFDKLNDELQQALTPLSSSLEEISWETMVEISANKLISYDSLSKFIGQTKSFTISGYGTFNAMCVGVRHDTKSDGSGKAAFSFMSVELITSVRADSGVADPWNNSDLRAYLYDNIYPAIQSDLKSSICQVKKNYNKTYTSSPTVGTIDEYVWVPSVKEIFGSNKYGDDVPMYEYWAKNPDPSLKRKSYVGESYTELWWLRNVASLYDYAVVTGSGDLSYTDSDANLRGLVLSFCI